MADTHSRLFKTNLAGWHELVALNEDYINLSFENMYKLADPTSPLRSFNKEMPGIATMKDCVLLPPKIELMVEDNNFNNLKYYLKFKTGRLFIDQGGNKGKEFDVAGWIFVFSIFIGTKPIPTDSEEFKEIAKRVAIPGDFSLSKLWLDSTRADTSSPKLLAESYFGGLDWSKEPSDIKIRFDFFIHLWISTTADAGETLIGVSVTPQSNKGTEVTFPPTFLAKQTYPWQDPAITPPPPPKTGNAKNMLLYLMMTGDANPPTPVAFPPGNGMWNDPTAQIRGSFAMSNELFWDKWLLPRLEPFNKDTQFYTTKMDVKVDGTEGTVWFNWLVGKNPAKAPYFDFIPGLPTNGYGYEWGPKTFDVSNSDGTGWFKIEAQQYAENSTSVRFKPGSQEIVLSGTGFSWCRMDLKGVTTPPWPTYIRLNVHLKWSMTLEIASISEGGLEIKIKPPTGKDGKYHECTYDIEDRLDWPGMHSDMTVYSAKIIAYLDQMFTVKINALRTTLLHQLNNQNKLYMPGSGTFFFKNGTFNSKGDFLTEIKYDGTNLDRAAILAKYEKEKAKAALQLHENGVLVPLEPLALHFNIEEMKDVPGWFGRYDQQVKKVVE